MTLYYGKKISFTVEQRISDLQFGRVDGYRMIIDVLEAGEILDVGETTDARVILLRGQTRLSTLPEDLDLSHLPETKRVDLSGTSLNISHVRKVAPTGGKPYPWGFWYIDEETEALILSVDDFLSHPVAVFDENEGFNVVGPEDSVLMDCFRNTHPEEFAY